MRVQLIIFISFFFCCTELPYVALVILNLSANVNKSKWKRITFAQRYLETTVMSKYPFFVFVHLHLLTSACDDCTRMWALRSASCIDGMTFIHWEDQLTTVHSSCLCAFVISKGGLCMRQHSGRSLLHVMMIMQLMPSCNFLFYSLCCYILNNWRCFIRICKCLISLE